MIIMHRNKQSYDSQGYLTQVLGKGIVLPVAYDTAWLARVPGFPNTEKPAFPLAIEYLRNSQMSDGSWGSKIYNAHGNTLSTLSALSALKEWGSIADEALIEKAVAALINLSKNLAGEEYETIGFELLLPTLINECRRLGIFLPEELNIYYEPYEKARAEKFLLIKKYHDQCGCDEPASWWFNLEMLGLDHLHNHNLDCDVNQHMLSTMGSVAASPAATAYLLSVMRYRGEDIPKVYQFLENSMSYSADNASLPNVFPIDEFEISFSANYFLEAGVTLSNTLLSKLIVDIARSWKTRQSKGLGYSSHFFIDPDCTANGMRALILAGYQENLQPDILLKFFNGTCIETYAGERNPSISTNIHTLMTLRLFENDARAQLAVTKITEWLGLKVSSDSDSPPFTDKWHFSPIYPTSRAVIALEGLDDTLAQQCVDWIVRNQHTDGSWGASGSTQEETAFAALSLTFWLSKGNPVDMFILKKAYHYLEGVTTAPEDTLWIGKTLYCPQNVVCALIFAAKFSLKNIMTNTSLHTSSSISDEFLSYDMGKIDSPEPLRLSGKLRRISPHFVPQKNTMLEKDNQRWLMDYGLWDKKREKSISAICFGSGFAFRSDNYNKLKIYTAFSSLILLFDDILDNQQHLISADDDLKKILQKILSVFDHNTQESLYSRNKNLPAYDGIRSAFSDISQRIFSLPTEKKYFIRSMKKTFDAWLYEFNTRKSDHQHNSFSYLEFRELGSALDLTIELAYLLQEINLSDSTRESEQFVLFRKLSCVALILSNDLLSFEKESKNENKEDNFLLIKQCEDQLSLQEAFDSCNAYYNDTALQLTQLKTSILSNPKLNVENDLSSALEIIEQHVQAHVEWALLTRRYKENC